MSIRLRLTLLYSAILALTLVVFGLALYSIQAQDTFNALKRDLQLSSGKLVDAAYRIGMEPPQQNKEQPGPPPPRSFNEFPSEQAFQDIHEREVARILDAAGNLVVSPFGREEDALPLSAEGLLALQNGQEWWQQEIVADERMLIYNRPVVQNGETVYILQVARSLTERDRTLKSLGITLSAAGLITILIAFGAGWALSSLSLRPIDRITHTAQAIGEERDFTQRVNYSGPSDEVGRLANTFNQMLARLQDAYEKVAHTLQLQRDFVADVSHELRTPLTTLRGNLGLLRRDPSMSEDEQIDILNDMVEESDRLIRLVTNLLVSARADAGHLLLDELLDVDHLIDEAIRQVRYLDQGREISLISIPDLSIRANRDAFKQVLLIVLDNALKHSDEEIEVSAEIVGGQVEIRVQDHGEGISPEKIPLVFDRFYRGEAGAAAPGYGLGLPIAKTLVESMGGAIAFESELNKGSTVILRFPNFRGAPEPA